MAGTLELKSKKLVAALIAAGVLGGAGMAAVELGLTPARAQPVENVAAANHAIFPAAMVMMPNPRWPRSTPTP